jgi:hypothetical protein
MHLLDRAGAQDRSHASGERSQVQRNLRTLRDEPSRAVEQRDRAIAPLLDVRGKRRAHERVVHVFRDRQQPIAEDFHRDRIEDLCGSRFGH